METQYTSRFDLVVTINGQHVILDVIGGMKIGNREFIVITDCPALEVSSEEYEILEIHRLEDEETAKGDIASVISSIQDNEEYEGLVKEWEARIDGERNISCS